MRKKTINKTEKTTKANGVSLTTRLARQQEIANREQRKLNDLRHEKEELIEKPKREKMVGKCYKYLNSYGGDRERWWLYTKVVGLDGTMLKTLQFQTTTLYDSGKAEIEEETHFSDMTGYIEITKDEWNAEWTKIATRVSELAG